MGKSARAIIIENDKLLLMSRDKEGSQYFTLVGGKVGDHETIEQALIREVREETGLEVTNYRLVFIEEHPQPHNQQYIYLCEVAPHSGLSIQKTSEEDLLNQIGISFHAPIWAYTNNFRAMQFRTPQLGAAIIDALKHGFPDQPVKL